MMIVTTSALLLFAVEAVDAVHMYFFITISLISWAHDT
jgi:hypothetical protein